MLWAPESKLYIYISIHHLLFRFPRASMTVVFSHIFLPKCMALDNAEGLWITSSLNNVHLHLGKSLSACHT